MPEELLEIAEGFSEDRDVSDIGQDPQNADSYTEFVGAVWNRYGGEVETGTVVDLLEGLGEMEGRLDERDYENIIAYFDPDTSYGSTGL